MVSWVPGTTLKQWTNQIGTPSRYRTMSDIHGVIELNGHQRTNQKKFGKT